MNSSVIEQKTVMRDKLHVDVPPSSTAITVHSAEYGTARPVSLIASDEMPPVLSPNTFQHLSQQQGHPPISPGLTIASSVVIPNEYSAFAQPAPTDDEIRMIFREELSRAARNDGTQSAGPRRPLPIVPGNTRAFLAPPSYSIR
jgi:hypothetical protein